MSTNSSITIQHNNEYRTIYCHYDGYPLHMFPLLNKYYNTNELANELIGLGDLFNLDKSMLCPPGHTFGSPIKGYCVAYGRDGGENNCKGGVFYSIKQIKRAFKSCRYHYLYNDGVWSEV